MSFNEISISLAEERRRGKGELSLILFAGKCHFFLSYFQFHSYFDPTGFRALSDADKRLIEQEIKETLLNETTITEDQPSTSSSPPSLNSITMADPSNRSSTTNSNKKQKTSTMEAFLKSIGDDSVPIQTTNRRSPIVEELRNYRLLVVGYNSKHPPSTSCLDFWRRHGSALPHLARLSRKFLCTPATSVPAESAFSMSANLARKERSRLSVKNLAATMFLKVSPENYIGRQKMRSCLLMAGCFCDGT